MIFNMRWGNHGTYLVIVVVQKSSPNSSIHKWGFSAVSRCRMCGYGVGVLVKWISTLIGLVWFWIWLNGCTEDRCGWCQPIGLQLGQDLKRKGESVLLLACHAVSSFNSVMPQPRHSALAPADYGLKLPHTVISDNPFLLYLLRVRRFASAIRKYDNSGLKESLYKQPLHKLPNLIKQIIDQSRHFRLKKYFTDKLILQFQT